MRIPFSPPALEQLMAKYLQDKDRFLYLLGSASPVTIDGRYAHWEKVRFSSAPGDMSPEEWWFSIKLARTSLYKTVSFRSISGDPMKYCVPDFIFEKLHWLDKNVSGTMALGQPILNGQMKNTYVISSLIEESIRSSQLEGATTTRRVAKKMIQQGRAPRDKNETMILNNYKAMAFVKELQHEELTPSLMLEIHRIVAAGTLDDESKCGKFRSEADTVIVTDETGEMLFDPPPANEIEHRVEQICQFANSKSDENHFIHPVIRSIILHFMISYTHPFVDGNGRTARILFYWSLLRHGYWLAEFISISKILKQAPAQYGYAFLFAETDENDLTYFIDHQIDVIQKAVFKFKSYMDRQLHEIETTNAALKNRRIREKFNLRQNSILKHAAHHPGYVYSITEHRNIHGIAYDTARKDLIGLSENPELLIRVRNGKAFSFISPSDIGERIKAVK